MKRSFEIVYIILNDQFLLLGFESTQLLCSYNYVDNGMSWQYPSTRISLSVIEFTVVEIKGTLEAPLFAPVPVFQTI